MATKVYFFQECFEDDYFSQPHPFLTAEACLLQLEDWLEYVDELSPNVEDGRTFDRSSWDGELFVFWSSSSGDRLCAIGSFTI
jgi:hypothetical protein